jgi:CheY-like chemotaxis protein
MINKWLSKFFNGMDVYDDIDNQTDCEKVSNGSYGKDEELEFVTEGTSEKVQLLVVEDNIDTQDMLMCLFETKNIPFDLAKNGEEALELLRYKPYSIVLMDIQLPNLSGSEVTQIVRKEENNPNRNSYIIATTAYIKDEDGVSFTKKGFDGYISKPYDIIQLADLIISKL